MNNELMSQDIQHNNLSFNNKDKKSNLKFSNSMIPTIVNKEKLINDDNSNENVQIYLEHLEAINQLKESEDKLIFNIKKKIEENKNNINNHDTLNLINDYICDIESILKRKNQLVKEMKYYIRS